MSDVATVPWSARKKYGARAAIVDITEVRVMLAALTAMRHFVGTESHYLYGWSQPSSKPENLHDVYSLHGESNIK